MPENFNKKRTMIWCGLQKGFEQKLVAEPFIKALVLLFLIS
jgi:hypothetical protein